ncbi:Two-component response regulator SSK1p [Parahypoxylon ruwenzoriense]
MGDLKARIKAKLLRRHSGVPTLSSSKQSSLGRDRASSSTHTQASTTGYAASLSTAGDEYEKGEVVVVAADGRGHIAKDNPGYGTVTSARDGAVINNFNYLNNKNSSRPRSHPGAESIRINNTNSVNEQPGSADTDRDRVAAVATEIVGRGRVGEVVEVVGAAPSQDRNETVPPELELLDRDPAVVVNSVTHTFTSTSTSTSPSSSGISSGISNANVRDGNANNLTRTPTSAQSGNDLQNSVVNSTTATTTSSTTTSNTNTSNTNTKTNTGININTNNSNNNAAPAPAPAASSSSSPSCDADANPTAVPSLPSIHENRPAASSVSSSVVVLPPHTHTHTRPHPQALHPHLKPPASNNHQQQYSDDTDADDHLHSPASAFVNNCTLPPSTPSSPLSRPAAPPRRQSILPSRQTTLIKALLNTGYASEIGAADPDQLLPISGNMVTRKVWVKRPLASPTLVTINEDDLVDDVRELILRKYANSLGRHYDAPDLTLRIYDREQQTTRTLQPEEPMGRTLDAHYPGGQSVDDALLIDIPARRTPKASPNPRYYGDDRPHESGTDYFPPYPPASQHPSASSTTAPNGAHQPHFPPSLTVLGGGQLAPLPSPGGTRRLGGSRPKMPRMHTASPVSTVTNGHASQPGGAPPTDDIDTPRPRTHRHPTAPPCFLPRPVNRPKKSKKPIEHPSLPPGMLNGGVPPINVLIVEDNIINLKLLEAFVKRLKVRWQTAMNGREAVNKWRAGGFHLVLMDIQLPVMSGLEATREIRRIEKVNSIGVFSSSASSPPEEVKAEPAEEDKLVNTEMFKSPVIIVALTASSLQSDRHEALAAGCNDFLTKPVNFVWLERKVMEWGCMQALIDFDGWRKWKDYSQKAEEDESKKAAAAKGNKFPKKNRLSMTTAAA